MIETPRLLQGLKGRPRVSLISVSIGLVWRSHIRLPPMAHSPGYEIKKTALQLLGSILKQTILKPFKLTKTGCIQFTVLSIQDRRERSLG